MAPRAGGRRERDYDFANVGITGRRTGVTVEHRPLDDHGFEQVSSFFSSPSKLSPSKGKESHVAGQADLRKTPKSSISARRSTRGASAPPPRSASPRKSGISGTAKRRNVIDRLAISDEDQLRQEHEQAKENQPPETPEHSTIIQSRKVGVATVPRRFSPEKTPLRSQTLLKPRTSHIERQSASAFNSNSRNETQLPSNRDRPKESSNAHVSELEEGPYNGADSEIDEPFHSLVEDNNANFDESQIVNDEEEEDYHITNTENRSKAQNREPTQANSRRKRKSDNLEDYAEPDTVSSPAAKRAKRRSEEGLDNGRHQMSAPVSGKVKPLQKVATKAKAPINQKNSNLYLSKEQEQELGDIVEKVRARPGQQKSLYILRKETPTDDGVTHTRSGRVSVKPLAYWRNERCVYGGSPGGASIADGARFPLNSIREIIRTEHVDTQSSKLKKKNTKSRKARGGSRATSELPASQVSEDEAGDFVDPDAEPWETDIGTLRGQVSVWDPEQQAPVEQEEEIDIAYASGAIETKEVKGSSFRYAKLLNTRFFSTGIVDLPPGAIKRPKNSRKMHMSFFVAKGRVTVEVGPMNGPECQFSIGKGGFWQVPRGNQYSIHNKHEGPARIFFSQACEPAPLDVED